MVLFHPTAAEWTGVLVLLVWVLRSAPTGARRIGPTLGAALLLAIGMAPPLDDYARHSVLLHALQSALLHQIAPVILAVLGFRPGARVLARLGPKAAGRVVAALGLGHVVMALLWVWPPLHLPLMQSAFLYSAMKWAMALIGLLFWCAIPAPVGRRLPVLLTALPQAAVGTLLLVLPPLYPMICVTMPNALLPLDWMLALDAASDQAAGGAVLLLAALVCPRGSRNVAGATDAGLAVRR
jgi:drug/metabolite transporter superfamily protein YnfA